MYHRAGPNSIRKETTSMESSTMEITKKKVYLNLHPKNKEKYKTMSNKVAKEIHSI